MSFAAEKAIELAVPPEHPKHMTVDDAILVLRADPSNRQRIIDSYLDEDLQRCAERFAKSDEFLEVVERCGDVRGKVVIDLGAGSGISTFAFMSAGADNVLAVEPDESLIVGRGALHKLCGKRKCQIIAAYGEDLPITDGVADVAYCRQVLHHTSDLCRVMKELFRCLKPGGILLACREHVVDDEEQLRCFLASHPVHQLAGGENAFSQDVYERAITTAGFTKLKSLSQWDTLISGFPHIARTRREFEQLPATELRRKLGVLGAALMLCPGLKNAVRRRLRRRRPPGQLYTFQAIKPLTVQHHRD